MNVVVIFVFGVNATIAFSSTQCLLFSFLYCHCETHFTFSGNFLFHESQAHNLSEHYAPCRMPAKQNVEKSRLDIQLSDCYSLPIQIVQFEIFTVYRRQHLKKIIINKFKCGGRSATPRAEKNARRFIPRSLRQLNSMLTFETHRTSCCGAVAAAAIRCC